MMKGSIKVIILQLFWVGFSCYEETPPHYDEHVGLLKSLSVGLDHYYTTNGFLPESLGDLVPDYIPPSKYSYFQEILYLKYDKTKALLLSPGLNGKVDTKISNEELQEERVVVLGDDRIRYFDASPDKGKRNKGKRERIQN